MRLLHTYMKQGRLFSSLWTILLWGSLTWGQSEEAGDQFDSSIDPDEAAETLASKGAGAYERKSIAFLDAVWNMDRSFFQMPRPVVREVEQGVREIFNNPRFDRNELSGEIQDRFVRRANAALGRYSGISKASISRSVEALTEVVNAELLPQILAAVEAEATTRAEGRLSEEQRNAMIVDKAKELGITAVELHQVRNAAFLVIPVVEGWSVVPTKEGVNVAVSLGAALWRIRVKDGHARAIPVAGIEGNGMGGSTGTLALPKATNAALRTALRNLEQKVKDLPEFRMSAQVSGKAGSVVEAKIGKKEGMRIDDKMRLVVETETDDGVEQKSVGWVRVVSIPDSAAEAQGERGRLAVVAGSPVEGDILTEYPRIPLDVSFGWGFRPTKLFAENDEDGTTPFVETAQQFTLGADYIIGRYFGVSQLYLGFGFGFSFAETTDDGKNNLRLFDGNSVESMSKMDFDLRLTKRLSYNRFGLLLQGGIGMSVMSWSDDAEDPPVPGSFYAYAGSGLDIALHPAWQLRTQVGWIFPSELNDGGLRQELEGLSIGVGLVWSPPGLPFDPVNLVTGL